MTDLTPKGPVGKMLDQLQRDSAMIDHNIVEVCRAYAELICSARRLRNDYYPHCFIAAARALLGSAPIDAMPHLDMVKKVLEIDTTVTTVSVVLLRASLMTMQEGTKRWVMRDVPTDPDAGSDHIPINITCPRCNKTSWNLNDIRNGWCDNCKAYTARETAP
jgi:hypothetical protein